MGSGEALPVLFCHYWEASLHLSTLHFCCRRIKSSATRSHPIGRHLKPQIPAAPDDSDFSENTFGKGKHLESRGNSTPRSSRQNSNPCSKNFTIHPKGTRTHNNTEHNSHTVSLSSAFWFGFDLDFFGESVNIIRLLQPSAATKRRPTYTE